jgi:Arc/MetJ-type ribon-helix-helix transcriptional regulator
MPAFTKTRTANDRRRITLRLPADLYAATQEAVRLGLAPNQNAFIEEAIRLRAREVRHVRMRRLAEEAMNDPGFVADMRETMETFRRADAERWPPGIEEESRKQAGSHRV